MMWSQICAPLSWNGVDEWVVVGRLFFKKGIHNPAVITSLHHVLQILQIDACCAEALPWCSPSIYSQSQHCKHCNHFGSTAVRTEHRVKFGEQRATAVAETAGWATDMARDRRRRGGSLFLSSVMSITYRQVLLWNLYHVRPQGAVWEPGFSSCVQWEGTDRDQRLAVTTSVVL